MTLVAYDPDRLDILALRLLDIAARLRNMAVSAREEELGAFELHDKKALEYLARLEDWLHKAQAAQQMQIVRLAGRRRGRAAAPPPPRRGAKRPASSRQK